MERPILRPIPSLRAVPRMTPSLMPSGNTLFTRWRAIMNFNSEAMTQAACFEPALPVVIVIIPVLG